MFEFIKEIFLTGLTVLSSLTSATPLSFISMHNHECKVRAEIINVNSDESNFIPLVLKQVNAVVVVIISINHMQK